MRKRVFLDFVVGLIVGSFLNAAVIVSLMLYDQQVSRWRMHEAEDKATRAEERAREAEDRAKKAEDRAREAEERAKESRTAIRDLERTVRWLKQLQPGLGGRKTNPEP